MLVDETDDLRPQETYHLSVNSVLLPKKIDSESAWMDAFHLELLFPTVGETVSDAPDKECHHFHMDQCDIQITTHDYIHVRM